MSDFFHPMTAQVSRKLRQCICCAYAIEKGERYCRQSGVWEGKYFTSHYHSECWDVLDADARNGGDMEFTPGSGDPPESARTMQEARAAASIASQNAGEEGV